LLPSGFFSGETGFPFCPFFSFQTPPYCAFMKNEFMSSAFSPFLCSVLLGTGPFFSLLPAPRREILGTARFAFLFPLFPLPFFSLMLVCPIELSLSSYSFLLFPFFPHDLPAQGRLFRSRTIPIPVPPGDYDRIGSFQQFLPRPRPADSFTFGFRFSCIFFPLLVRGLGSPRALAPPPTLTFFPLVVPVFGMSISPFCSHF